VGHRLSESAQAVKDVTGWPVTGYGPGPRRVPSGVKRCENRRDRSFRVAYPVKGGIATKLGEFEGLFRLEYSEAPSLARGPGPRQSESLV
jgi:hypothetical protein